MIWKFVQEIGFWWSVMALVFGFFATVHSAVFEKALSEAERQKIDGGYRW